MCSCCPTGTNPVARNVKSKERNFIIPAFRGMGSVPDVPAARRDTHEPTPWVANQRAACRWVQARKGTSPRFPGVQFPSPINTRNALTTDRDANRPPMYLKIYFPAGGISESASQHKPPRRAAAKHGWRSHPHRTIPGTRLLRDKRP